MTNRKWMQRIVCVALLTVSAFSLTACNTISGAGKDTEKAGEKLHDAAEDAKH